MLSGKRKTVSNVWKQVSFPFFIHLHFFVFFLDAQLFFHLISNLCKRIEQPGFKKRYTKNA